MADDGVEVRLGDEDRGALDAVVHDAAAGGVVVDVLEALREVGGDLHAGEPGGERGEAGVPAVAEAVGEGGAGDVVVDEVDAVGGEGGAEELRDAAVVALADGGEAGGEEGGVAAEGARADERVVAAEGAAPGGGGAAGQEVVGGGGDFGEGEEDGFFGEGVAEAGDGGSA